MNKLFGTAIAIGTLVLSSTAMAATLCAKSSGSAAVVTPIKGTNTCRSTETAIQTEPPAVTARQAKFFNQIGQTLGSPLATPMFVTVSEPGTYVVVASGVLNYSTDYPWTPTNENGVIQCRLKKRDTAGRLSEGLSTTTTVQNVKKYASDPMATTATGYLLPGEGVELTCQSYSESTWKALSIGFNELKLTAVKVSGVSEKVVNEIPVQIR